MRRPAALYAVVWGLLAPASAAADGWELMLLAGWTAPTYEQTLVSDRELSIPELGADVAVHQEGVFGLTARGGAGVGGAAAYLFTDYLGIEARIDSVDFTIDTTAPRLAATVDLPAPFSTALVDLDLRQGRVDVERLSPFSINLKARTPGAVRLGVSAGLSYLPRLRVDVRQPVRLGITGSGADRLELAAVEVGVGALAGDGARFGVNVGIGVEVAAGGPLALVVETRVFRFEDARLDWRGLTAPGSALEERVLAELERRLPAISFTPIYFQVTGGLSVRF